MKSKKKILITIIGFIVLIGAGIASYYLYEGLNYIKTEDARISTNLVSVTPQISGSITAWNVAEGDFVKAGSVLGYQDTGLVATSSGLSVGSLNQVGSITVNKGEITAPISGKIIKSNVQKGQEVGPGQVLAIIADTDNMYVSANIEETKVGKIKVGQKVDVTIDALNNKHFIGRVESIGQATVSTFSVLPVQNSSSNFTKVTQLVPIKILFPEINDLNLMPGMSVEVKIHVKDN